MVSMAFLQFTSFTFSDGLGPISQIGGTKSLAELATGLSGLIMVEKLTNHLRRGENVRQPTCYNIPDVFRL